MTKKHFIKIAAIVKVARKESRETHPIDRIAYALADYFKDENPRFQKRTFLEACGVPMSEVSA